MAVRFQLPVAPHPHGPHDPAVLRAQHRGPLRAGPHGHNALRGQTADTSIAVSGLAQCRL